MHWERGKEGGHSGPACLSFPSVLQDCNCPQCYSMDGNEGWVGERRDEEGLVPEVRVSPQCYGMDGNGWGRREGRGAAIQVLLVLVSSVRYRIATVLSATGWMGWGSGRAA